MKQIQSKASRNQDAKLLTQFVNDQDENAFSQIVAKYQRLVWNVCHRLLADRTDAEDAFQNTFVILATKAARIRKPKSLASWIYGTAYRTASQIRRQRQHSQLPDEEWIDPDSSQDILEQVAKKYESEMVIDELMSLSDRLKTPLILFYLVGHSANQIAKDLGLSLATVEGRLRRGRTALRSRLLRRGIGIGSISVCLASLNSTANSALVSKTISTGMTASTGSLTTPFSDAAPLHSGIKLMILKSTLGLAIVVFLGFGIAMHTAPTKADHSIPFTVANGQPVNQEQSDDSATFEMEQELDDSEDVEQTNGSVLQHIHEVLYRWHQDLYEQFHGSE